jgi:hypothetical protein
MPNSGDKTTQPPSMTPLVTDQGAIDTSGIPPVDESGLPASRIMGHEEYEVGLRGVFKAMAWLIVVLIVALIVVYVTMFGFKNSLLASELEKTGVIEAAPLPPEPRLQPSRGHEFLEWDERKQVAGAWHGILTRYGWIDEKARIVHIPIDRAIELAVEDPAILPARKNGERPAR